MAHYEFRKDKIIKRQHSSIWDKHLCHIQIKVSKPVDGTAVTIERLDSHIHTHDIEESFCIKKPSILQGYLKSEAIKNYSAAQIYHAVRGASTHEGSEWLGKLGGSSLKQQDIVNLKREMKSSDLRTLPHGQQFQDDILQACSLLMERGWLFEELQIVDNAVKDVDNRASVAKTNFRNRKLTVCTKQYLEIGQLPVPIQKLLAVELDAVVDRIAKGKEVSDFNENLRCQCKFYRQYLLPCRHIFHLGTEVKVLTTARWKKSLMMFEEYGMEVYETMGTVWVEEDSDHNDVEMTSQIIQVQARCEQVQQQLYVIQESIEHLNLDNTVRSQRMEEWMNHVQVTLDSLTSLRAEDIASRNRPWEL
ncbi:hypothetical protein EV426DRAFT_671625 [Tirmania nivea]|nr:hypothetical protein EV426DRAFT_671625 [Tirmania nivea]